MAKSASATCEELLSAWLVATSTIRNDRLVQSMSYNEMLILGILSKNESEDKLSPKELAAITGMIKSQINSVLSKLSEKQLISVKQNKADKRSQEVTITKKGAKAYEKEHAKVLELVKAVYDGLGNKEASELAKGLIKASEAFANVGNE